jgi:hypothetical protein
MEKKTNNKNLVVPQIFQSQLPFLFFLFLQELAQVQTEKKKLHPLI